MKKHFLRRSLLTVLLGVLVFSMTVMADVYKLNISQIVQEGNDVYVYVNLLDDKGKPAEALVSAEQFTVSINEGQAIPVQEAAAGQALDHGVSYIFCIDISKSVTAQEMEEIRSSMSSFVNSMSAQDYAGIITIGSEINTVCSLTQDRNALQTAIQSVDRTANYTYLYKGISYALDGQRKKIEEMPERTAVILFTDGMDDSDGASGETQVLTDIADIRVPIYVVGLKGNDANASLQSVGQIAKQSGGSLLSYSDMSISEAVQTIGDINRNTYQLLIQPDTDYFGTPSLEWKATYKIGEGNTLLSTRYVYSLSMDGVVIETEPITEKPTEAPTEEPTEEPAEEPMEELTEPETEPYIEPAEPSVIEKILTFVKENVIICAAAGLILIGLIILLVLLINKNKPEPIAVMDPSVNYTMNDYRINNNREMTLADTKTMDDERTIDELSLHDEEETVNGSMDMGLKLEFEITFSGFTETIERVLRDQIVLGRGNECDVDVVLHSMSDDRKHTSRKHAIIVVQPDGLCVRDNSKNKTFVNGMEVMGEMALKNDDVLQLGKATVKVRILSY